MLYRKLTTPGELVMLAAQTGKRKSLLNTNILAKNLMEGTKSGLVNLEMQVEKTRRRLTYMLLDHPADIQITKDKFSAETLEAYNDAMGLLKVEDFSMMSNRTPANVLFAVKELIKDGVTLVVVDALERAAPSCGGKERLVEFINNLADLAHEHDVSIVATSQIKGSGALQEIVHPNELAFACEKEHEAGLVACLGERVTGQLDTLCFTKCRNYGPSSRSVFRLSVSPSLRMEVLPVAEFSVPLNASRKRYEVERYGDIPEDLEAGVERIFDRNAILPPHPVKNGFIQIGREVARSPMFRNREAQYVYWLLDLYFCAHFSPGSPVKTPKSGITVMLDRGQYLTTENQLMNRWNATSRSVVRRFLDTAIREKLISVQHVLSNGTLTPPIKPSNERLNEPNIRTHGSVITVLHYVANKDDQQKGSAQ